LKGNFKPSEMYRLQGVIQHYSWGGNTFLPTLLNQNNPEGKPFAEYWLGVHPGGPGTIGLGHGAMTQLNNLIGSDKLKHLGGKTLQQFNGLPFLFKILDVKDMLSIQVHPNKEKAKQGFLDEVQRGIDISAPHRNYKDQNHKPEVMVALSEFWLLHGFAANIEERLKQFPFLQQFLPQFQAGGLKTLYEYLLRLPQASVNELIAKHAEKIIPLYLANQLQKENPDFWAARAMLNLCADGQYDKGIFSIYLMNILHLQPGEGIFQGAGLLHAYLEGQNVELMANSDNVLRAGLTPKHIDIPQLLDNTDFVVTNPQIIQVSLNNGFQEYPCDTSDFLIQRVLLIQGEEREMRLAGPSIVLQINGEAQWKGYTHWVANGLQSFFVDPFESILIKAKTETELFIASVPV
jgi:mannose-6-phosphate isomerase